MRDPSGETWVQYEIDRVVEVLAPSPEWAARQAGALRRQSLALAVVGTLGVGGAIVALAVTSPGPSTLVLSVVGTAAVALSLGYRVWELGWHAAKWEPKITRYCAARRALGSLHPVYDCAGMKRGIARQRFETLEKELLELFGVGTDGLRRATSDEFDVVRFWQARLTGILATPEEVAAHVWQRQGQLAHERAQAPGVPTPTLLALMQRWFDPVHRRCDPRSPGGFADDGHADGKGSHDDDEDGGAPGKWGRWGLREDDWLFPTDLFEQADGHAGWVSRLDRKGRGEGKEVKGRSSQDGEHDMTAAASDDLLAALEAARRLATEYSTMWQTFLLDVAGIEEKAQADRAALRRQLAALRAGDNVQYAGQVLGRFLEDNKGRNPLLADGVREVGAAMASSLREAPVHQALATVKQQRRLALTQREATLKESATKLLPLWLDVLRRSTLVCVRDLPWQGETVRATGAR